MSHDNQVTNYQPRARSVILPSPCLVQYFERRQDTDLNASKQYHGIKSMSSQNMTRDSQSINVDSTEYYIVRRDTHVQKRNCGATHTSGPRQAKRFFFCVFAFFCSFLLFPALPFPDTAWAALASTPTCSKNVSFSASKILSPPSPCFEGSLPCEANIIC